MEPTLRRLVASDVPDVVAFAVRAWAPVHAAMAEVMGDEIFARVYPDWAAAQAKDVADVCSDRDSTVMVVVMDAKAVGFVAVRYGNEGGTTTGEVDMLAVDPSYQRQGLAQTLMTWAVGEIEAAGVGMAVIATGGDPGHAPARALYERFGFRAYPQVRYYRPTADRGGARPAEVALDSRPR